MDEEARKRIERLEHNGIVLGTMLGLVTGIIARERADPHFAELMRAGRLALAQLGISGDFVDAFVGGAKVGMEPPDHDGDGKQAPVEQIANLFKKAA